MIYLICPQPRKPVECKAQRRDVAVLRQGVATPASERFAELPGGFERKGRIAALRRLLRGPP